MIAVVVVAAVLSALLVGIVRRDAVRRGLIDRPNDRSSHLTPTPRGGGLGLIVAIGSALVYAAGRVGFGSPEVNVALATLAVALVAVIGWVDDHGGAAVGVRLAVHVLAGVLLLPLVRTVPLPVLLGPVALGWWVLWTVSAINVVNFMDGIDGIIGLQGLVFGAYCGLVGEPGGSAQLLGFALAGASLGFLVWNWNPARIFMGDVGSGALGVVFVATGAVLAREGRVGFVAAYAPLMPIFLDAAVTLLARLRRGERLSEAHRNHLYQRLANGGLGHARVALAFGGASLLAAGAAAAVPAGGPYLLVPLLFAFTLAGAFADRRWRSAPSVLP